MDKGDWIIKLRYHLIKICHQQSFFKQTHIYHIIMLMLRYFLKKIYFNSTDMNYCISFCQKQIKKNNSSDQDVVQTLS